MLYLFTALSCEADPLIKHLRLTPNASLAPTKLYENPDCVLVITGVGKKNASRTVRVIVMEIYGYLQKMEYYDLVF